VQMEREWRCELQRDRTGDSVAGVDVDVIVWGPIGQSGVQAAAVAHVMEPQRRSSIVQRWRGKCGSYFEIYMLSACLVYHRPPY